VLETDRAGPCAGLANKLNTAVGEAARWGGREVSGRGLGFGVQEEGIWIFRVPGLWVVGVGV